jgi:hypothetical protein
MTRFTVLLIASMLVAGLHGAAPAWAGHSSDCGGGVACSWVDPPAGASGGNVTPYTPPPPDPFAFRLQRFQAVTAQVRNVIGDRVGTPANDQDMSTQLGALYDIMFEFAATARLRAAQANARVEAISPMLKALEMESDRAYLNYHEQILPQTKQAEARAAALTEQVARAKVMRDQISTTQRYFEGWARAQKTSIGRWFNVVLPASREVAELRPPFIPMPLRGIAQPPPLVILQCRRRRRRARSPTRRRQRRPSPRRRSQRCRVRLKSDSRRRSAWRLTSPRQPRAPISRQPP